MSGFVPRLWIDFTDDLDAEALNDLEARINAAAGSGLGLFGDLVPAALHYPYFVSDVLVGKLPIATDPATAGFTGGPGVGLWGYNPSYERNPDNTRKWLNIDAVIGVEHGTGNRAFFRSANLTNVVDPSELVFERANADLSANGYGTNDDGSDLLGLSHGSTIGFVVWKGAIAVADGNDPSVQGDSGRIGVTVAEDVRQDSLTRFLLSSTTLPQSTITVNSSLDTTPGEDGSVRPWEDNGAFKIDGQVITYAARTGTKLLGCIGGTGTYAGGTEVTQVQTKSGASMSIKTSTIGSADSAERIRIDGPGGMRMGKSVMNTNVPTWFNIGGGQGRYERLRDPTNLTYDIVGTPGSKTITYTVVGNAPYGDGMSNPLSITITDAPTTLSDTNYIRLEWDAVPGYESFDVIREATDGTPSGTGPIVLHQRYYLGGNSQYGNTAVDNGLSVGGLNEVQTIQLVRADGGTMKWTFDGQTTAPIAWDASGPTVQTALRALSNLTPDYVTVLKLDTDTWQVTFVNALGDTNVPQITVDPRGLTNSVDPDEFPHAGAPPEADITTVVQGLGSTYTAPTRNTTGDFQFDGAVGFHGEAPIPKPGITGDRSSATVAVLTDLLAALEDLGLITDSTTA